MPATLDTSPRDREVLADLDAIADGVLARDRLARHLGVGESTLSRWWTGERALPISGLLAIGRRVASGSPEAGARFLEAIARGIGLEGSWLVSGPASPASAHTALALCQRAGDAARLLGDGVVACDEVNETRELAVHLRQIAAQLEAAAKRAA